MRHHFHTALAVAVLCWPALAAQPARAEAVVGEGDAIGVTPSLGRGYTPASGTFHSVCFDAMPTTKATFDFDYAFEAIEDSAAATQRVHASLQTYEVEDFVARNTRERRLTSGQSTRYFHYMLAALVVDSYYSSIDEAHAAISKDALALLKAGDVVSFFTSCGTHYVRSISRRSYFLTLFSYATTDSKRDRSFELQVEQQVRQVHGAPGAAAPARADAAFQDQARRVDLKIVTRSIGLVAQSSAALLPFDLATYQASVKQAFQASQDEFTGRITALETYPWLSNTQILVLLGALATSAGDKVDWSARKRVLSDNAEFYIELAGRLMTTTSALHRAEACRQALDVAAFYDHKLRPELIGARIVNHRTGERGTLAALLEALSDENLDRMRAIGMSLRGGTDGKSGAAACLAELESTHLSGRYHNDIESCRWAREPLPHAQLIDDYCMPQIEPVNAAATKP